MANIQKYLDDIKKALFGREVRSSIHDAIEAINKETERTTASQEHLDSTFKQLIINAGQSNAEVVDARVEADGTPHATLGDRLDSIDSNIDITNKEVIAARTDKNGVTNTNLKERLDKVDVRLEDINDQYLMINVKDYGAKGDGATDDTQSIIQAKNVSLRENKTLYFPEGVYCYTDLGNLAYKDLKILGSGHKEVTLKCISTAQDHKAIYFDAYEGGANSPILQGIVFENIIVSGNEKTKHIIYCQGVANMHWKNIYYRECGINGIGLQLNGCHSSNFHNVSCGHNLTGTTNLNPSIGIQFDFGVRGGVIEGRSTNNTFQNCYVENCETGIHLINGDQNVFQSCASQANTGVGVKIEKDARMTTFIGCGFEKNKGLVNGKTTDVNDNGRLTTYINCYTDKYMLLAGQQNVILGGNYRAVHCTGTYNTINNIRVNYGGVDEGGFTDDGVGTKISSIANLDGGLNEYIYPQLKARTRINADKSPFTFKNETGKLIEVVMQAGTMDRVQKKRGGDNPFLCNPTAPSTYLLAPTESLIFTWTGDINKPDLSYIVYNGF